MNSMKDFEAFKIHASNLENYKDVEIFKTCFRDKRCPEEISSVLGPDYAYCELNRLANGLQAAAKIIAPKSIDLRKNERQRKFLRGSANCGTMTHLGYQVRFVEKHFAIFFAGRSVFTSVFFELNCEQEEAFFWELKSFNWKSR